MTAYHYRKPYENSYFVERIDFQFDAIKKFVDMVEEHAIPLHEEKRIQSYIDLLDMRSNEHLEPSFLFYTPESFLDEVIYGHFKNIFFANAVFCTYSFLERTLLFACRLNEKERQIKLKDISGKGIIKYRIYLEKVTHLDFKTIENHWNEVLKLNKIRNHLSHDMDVYDDNLNDFVNVCKNLKGVEVTNDALNVPSIIFSNVEFIREFNKSIYKIIHHVFYEESKLLQEEGYVL